MCIFGGSKPPPAPAPAPPTPAPDAPTLKIKSNEDVTNKKGKKGQYAGRNNLKINLAGASTASEGAGVNLPQG